MSENGAVQTRKRVLRAAALVCAAAGIGLMHLGWGSSSPVLLASVVTLATASALALQASGGGGKAPVRRDRYDVDDHRVLFDEQGVSRYHPDGKEESLDWKDLVEVQIVTTSDGPWHDDVHWLLVGAEGRGGCAVPSEAEGSQALLARLQQLPDFDNEKVIEAMSCTSDARFVVWRRPS